LEKLDLASSTNALSLNDAVMEAARIIYVAHEDSKDKEFELEMTWISHHAGPTKGRHEEVPKELFEAAVKAAKKAMPEYDDSDEEQGDDGGDQMQE
jgi:20S proteasome subunit alpha 7